MNVLPAQDNDGGRGSLVWALPARDNDASVFPNALQRSVRHQYALPKKRIQDQGGLGNSGFNEAQEAHCCRSPLLCGAQLPVPFPHVL